jgi:hypothetical protein
MKSVSSYGNGGGTNLTPAVYYYFLRALDAAAPFELFVDAARFFPPEDLTVRPLRPSLWTLPAFIRLS